CTPRRLSVSPAVRLPSPPSAPCKYLPVPPLPLPTPPDSAPVGGFAIQFRIAQPALQVPHRYRIRRPLHLGFEMLLHTPPPISLLRHAGAVPLFQNLAPLFLTQ